MDCSRRGCAGGAREREIEPVCDLPIGSAGALDGLLAINPVPGKDHHSTDRVPDGPERFVLFLGDQLGDNETDFGIVMGDVF
jgi:hypothetical protein